MVMFMRLWFPLYDHHSATSKQEIDMRFIFRWVPSNTLVFFTQPINSM